MTEVLFAPDQPENIELIEPIPHTVVVYPDGISELDLNELERQVARRLVTNRYGVDSHLVVADTRFSAIPGQVKASEATIGPPQTRRRIQLLAGIYPGDLLPDVSYEKYVFLLDQAFVHRSRSAAEEHRMYALLYGTKAVDTESMPTRSIYPVDKDFLRRKGRFRELIIHTLPKLAIETSLSQFK